MRIVRVVVGCLLASGVISSACLPAVFAETPPASRSSRDDIYVARLIGELSSDSYAARLHANDTLATLGTAARSQLELATRDSDPEVRLRAKELLRRLKVLDIWSPTEVRMPEGKLAAAKFIAALSEQTGNHVLLGDQYGSFRDQDIALEAQAGPFWQLLDEICLKSGNRVRTHYDTRQPGLVVVAGTAARHPLAYAGPVRAQIVSARRAFTEELDYENLNSELTHTFQLNLQMTWEDRFRLVAYRSQPELISAITDTKVELSATQSAGSGWNVAGSGTRQVSMNLRLHPPATAAKELDTLKLKWALVAVGDIATLEVTNLQSAEPHYQDDVEFIIESLQAATGGRYELTVAINRDLVIPEPPEILFQENDLELFDAAGRAFRKQGQTNSVTETGAKAKITFLGETADSLPHVLRLSYPRLRAQRDLEIVFRHVPLPVGRPE